MIKEKIRNLSGGLKSAIGYTLSVIFSRGLALITVPLFTRIMTTEQVGIVNLYNSWYALISVIATLGLTSGGFIVAMKEYENKREQYQSAVLSLTSLISFILAVLYCVYPSFWNKITGLPTELMILMLVGFFVAPARDFWLARRRYEYRYKLSTILTIISAIIATIFSIVVVVFENKNGYSNTAVGRLIANYLVIYGISAIIWVILIAKGKTFFNKEYWKMSLTLSLPLVGYNIAAQILNASDRMMISKFIGNSAVGIYGTVYTVSSMSLLIWQAVNSSFVPYLFQNIDTKNNNIKKYSFELLLAYSIIAILLTFLAPEIVRILAPVEYYEAIYMMPPIAAGVFFTSLAQMYSNIVVYYKKTKYVMYPAIIAAAINVILNAIFIPLCGYMAAAYTTLFGYIVWAIAQMMWANKVSFSCGLSTNHVYDDKKIIILAILTVIISMVSLFLYGYAIIRYIITGVFLVIGIIIFRKIIHTRKLK